MPESDPVWESTLSLLTRVRGGDEAALNDLFARYLPLMRRWAAGRLPRWARDRFTGDTLWGLRQAALLDRRQKM
jgi:RNA polymerase sigma-70 factor, ECF subfamily